MLLTALTIENFMGFKRAHVDLTEPGVTVIEGSNGSGKSALFDAILWGLFGRTGRDLPAGKVVRRFTADPCMVQIDVTLPDSREIQVTRRRTAGGRLSLDVTGLKKGTTADSQDVLEEILGCDFRLFTTASMFTGQIATFCRMPDAERKAVLERLLGIEHFLKAREVAAADARQLEGKLQAERSELEYVQNRLVEVDVKMSEVRALLEAWDKRRKQRILSARFIYFETFVEEAEHFCSHVDLVESQQELEENFAARFAEWSRRRDEVVAAGKSKQEAVVSNRVLVGQTEALLASYKSELAAFETREAKQPQTCPTCGQLWPKRAVQVDRRPVQAKIVALEEALSQHRNLVRRAEADLGDHQKTVQALETTRPAQPDRAVVQRSSELCTTLTRSLERAGANLQSVLSESVNPHQAQHKALKDEHRDLGVRAQKAKEVATLTALHAAATYWAAGYSRKGLPALLLDESVPQLNASVRKYATAITGGRVRVTFDPAQEKGSGTTFGMSVEFTQGADSYVGGSNGERTRVDLAVLLAVRELSASRSGASIPQIWMDEVFDGLDPAGAEAVAEMLRGPLFRGVKVYLITWCEALKAAGDRVLTVVKSGNESVIRKAEDAEND